VLPVVMLPFTTTLPPFAFTPVPPVPTDMLPLIVTEAVDPVTDISIFTPLPEVVHSMLPLTVTLALSFTYTPLKLSPPVMLPFTVTSAP
jgi:hypothetical protein